METIRSPDTSFLTIATRRKIPQDGILHRLRRENLKSYIALTGWTLQRKCNVSPVSYEMGFYIPEDGILHMVSVVSRRINNQCLLETTASVV
jgi:hypothetical protein